MFHHCCPVHVKILSKTKCSAVSTWLADGNFYILFITILCISVSKFSLARDCWVPVCILQNLLRPLRSSFHSRILCAGRGSKYVNINSRICRMVTGLSDIF